MKILKAAGYNNNIALRGLNKDVVTVLEQYVQNKLKTLLANSVYSEMEFFSFLPGHTTLLLALPAHVEKFENSHPKRDPNVVDLNSLTLLMKEMIETARENCSKDVKHHKFSSIIQNFATYIYTICGKSCYEILCHNLPLPQPNTVCKLKARLKAKYFSTQLHIYINLDII